MIAPASSRGAVGYSPTDSVYCSDYSHLSLPVHDHGMTHFRASLLDESHGFEGVRLLRIQERALDLQVCRNYSKMRAATRRGGRDEEQRKG